VQSEFLHKWSGVFGYAMNMIYLAYEEMANHTDKISFAYMNKVLENWHEAGVRTPEDVERLKQEKAAAKAKSKKPTEGHAPSYDLDAFMQHSAQDPIVYKKKNEGGAEEP
jgi:DnaD/phage-associated family protein